MGAGESAARLQDAGCRHPADSASDRFADVKRSRCAASSRTTSGLLVARIEVVARRRRGHSFGPRPMRTTAAARLEAVARAVRMAVGLESAIHLRLRPGDKGRQPVHAAAVGNRNRLGLRLGLVLRRRAMLAVIVALVLARLIGLAVALMLARNEGLRLRRDEAGLLAEIRETFALVLAVLGRHFVVGPGLRLVLTELLLRGRDQAEIMLGVLIVVLRRDRIAGTARVARELHVFLRDMGGGAADLNIRAVGFENPGHRALPAPDVVVAAGVVVPVAHPLVVVLTVSHVLPLLPALRLEG